MSVSSNTRRSGYGYDQRIEAFGSAGLATAGNVAPDTLYVQMTPAGAEAGADVLNYANAPSDVSDSLGRFLAAFDGFPLA